MNNQQNTLDEWVDELLDKHITRESHKGAVNRIRHQLKQAILQKFQEVEREATEKRFAELAQKLMNFERDYKDDELKEFNSGFNHGIWVAVDVIGEEIGEEEYAYQLTPTSQGDSK